MSGVPCGVTCLVREKEEIVCVREYERERDRERERERQRQTERETEIDRETERDRERQTETDRDRERHNSLTGAYLPSNITVLNNGDPKLIPYIIILAAHSCLSAVVCFLYVLLCSSTAQYGNFQYCINIYAA